MRLLAASIAPAVLLLLLLLLPPEIDPAPRMPALGVADGSCAHASNHAGLVLGAFLGAAAGGGVLLAMGGLTT